MHLKKKKKILQLENLDAELLPAMSFMILVMINFWIIIPICMQVIN